MKHNKNYYSKIFNIHLPFFFTFQNMSNNTLFSYGVDKHSIYVATDIGVDENGLINEIKILNKKIAVPIKENSIHRYNFIMQPN